MFEDLFIQNRLLSFFSATTNSILDRAIDSEDAQHKDFLRLVKTRCFFLFIFLKKVVSGLALFFPLSSQKV